MLQVLCNNYNAVVKCLHRMLTNYNKEYVLQYKSQSNTIDNIIESNTDILIILLSMSNTRMKV